MRNSLLTAGLAIGLLASASAFATPSNPYSYTMDILDTFTELSDDPNGSAVVTFDIDGTIDSNGEVFIAWLETPAEITLGNNTDALLVDAAYDGIELKLHNSSQAPNNSTDPVDITAYLFATYLDDAVVVTDVGNAVVIGEETAELLTLDFSVLSEDRELISYGFVVAVDDDYGSNGSHVVASVPEPSTLAAMGAGLLALSFVARRKASI